MFQYADHLITAALAAAGALTVARALPAWSRHLTQIPSRELVVLAVTAAVLWVGISGYEEWMPGLTPLPGQTVDSTITAGYAPESSFLQALPNGSYPRYAPATGRFPAFPAKTIIADVDATRGRHALPLTLSWARRDRDGEWDWQAYDNPTVKTVSSGRPRSRDVTAEPTSAN